MGWFRIDDRFPDHPKWDPLFDHPRRYANALTLWVAVGCYCRAHAIDGKVTPSIVRQKSIFNTRETNQAVQDLELCGFWKRTNDGWEYHDWLDFQPSSAEEQRKRAQATARQQRRRSGGNNGEPGKVTRDKPVTPPKPSRVTPPTPTRPDPTRPNSKNNDLQEIAQLEERYPEGLVLEARGACALSRRNGRMADSVWLRTLQKLDTYSKPAVIDAMRMMIERYADGDKSEAYMIAIARRNNNGKHKAKGPSESDWSDVPETPRSEPPPGWNGEIKLVQPPPMRKS